MAILRYPENIDGSTSDYVRFQFFNYAAPYAGGPITGAASGSSYNASANALKPSDLDDVVITMPNDISSRINGNWGGTNLTGLAAAAYGAVGGISGLATATGGQNFVDKANATLKGTFDAGLKGLAEDALKTVVDKINTAPGLGSNLTLNDALGLVSGYIINPNTELLYSGTGLRDHGYSFKMIAQSEKEAEVIQKIANTFKIAAAPKGNKAILDQTVRNFIGIPDVCRVTFHIAGSTKEHPYLPRYKTSAITNVSANYVTEGQYMTFSDGKPIGINLSVSFRELKLLFADEIGDGDTKFR